MAARLSAQQKRYRKYLTTEHWKRLREEALARDHRSCFKCGQNVGLEVHHLRYRDPLESCTTDDVVTLCGLCHLSAHNLAWGKPFDMLMRALELAIHNDKPFTHQQLRRVARLARSESEHKAVEALLRDIAKTRIRHPGKWDSWLKKPDRVYRRFWAWSMEKRLELQKS